MEVRTDARRKQPENRINLRNAKALHFATFQTEARLRHEYLMKNQTNEQQPSKSLLPAVSSGESSAF